MSNGDVLLIGLLISLPVMGVIAGVAGILVRHKRWRGVLTLSQFVELHPECKTDRGIRCAACSSGSIKNWGWEGANDARRTFTCNHCGNLLYRNG